MLYGSSLKVLVCLPLHHLATVILAQLLHLNKVTLIQVRVTHCFAEYADFLCQQLYCKYRKLTEEPNQNNLRNFLYSHRGDAAPMSTKLNSCAATWQVK